jgi:hypothetical protein
MGAIGVFVLVGSFTLPAIVTGIILIVIYAIYIASVIHQDNVARQYKLQMKKETGIVGSQLLASSVILKESVKNMDYVGAIGRPSFESLGRAICRNMVEGKEESIYKQYENKHFH